MKYNLLFEPWLLVQLENGENRWISVHEIVSTGPFKPMRLNFPRSDFNAAVLEFLIGFFQTVFAVGSRRQWKEFLENPPSPEELQAAFAAYKDYFNLLGQRPRFMQDLTLSAKDVKSTYDVSGLFMEQPGENTIKANKDLFIKRGKIQELCPACAAAALYTLQSFAPSGGAGHRTSMRGGGPLSTTLIGETLWQSIWLNVLPVGEGLDAMPVVNCAPEELFPWTKSTPTSEKGETVEHIDMPLQHTFWSMPRRIILQECDSKASCSICGRSHEKMISSYITKNYGINYGAFWKHPCTPYRAMGGGAAPLSIKGQSNTAAYGNWLGITHGEPSTFGAKEHKAIRPARCISKPAKLNKYCQGISAAGYNMDNMKAVSWCEHSFPLYTVNGDEEEFRSIVHTMVQGANEVCNTLARCIRSAFGNEKASLDASYFSDIKSQFWMITEAKFYGDIKNLGDFEDLEDDAVELVRHEWGVYLRITALKIYHSLMFECAYSWDSMEKRIEQEKKLKAFTVTLLRKMDLYPPKKD